MTAETSAVLIVEFREPDHVEDARSLLPVCAFEALSDRPLASVLLSMNLIRPARRPRLRIDPHHATQGVIHDAYADDAGETLPEFLPGHALKLLDGSRGVP